MVYNSVVMYRNSYLKIDLDNYRFNINYLKKKAGKELIAIIKADAYGLIDGFAAKILHEEGVKIFGVSSLDEALALRQKGFKEEILILGYVDSDYLDLIRQHDLSIPTVSKAYIAELLRHDLHGIKIHIKVDTGMNRIGLEMEEVGECLAALKAKGAKIEGIFTHYASSDCDLDFTKLQYERFKQTIDHLDHPFKYIHTANTDATLSFADEVSTHVRCGIGLLGYSSFKSELRPCMSLYTSIDNLKLVHKGEGISYSQTYILDEDAYIATLPIGYADGIIRHNKGRKVYVGKEYAPIVGNICMDQMMIRVAKEYPTNEPVEIFGDHISIYEMAKELDTIPYEILTLLSDRLTRVYTQGKTVIKTITPRFKGAENE